MLFCTRVRNGTQMGSEARDRDGDRKVVISDDEERGPSQNHIYSRLSHVKVVLNKMFR